jgi:hypothetical protein
MRPIRANPQSVAFTVSVYLAANHKDWLTLADVIVNTGATEYSAARSLRRAAALGLVRIEKHREYGTVYHPGPALLKLAGCA